MAGLEFVARAAVPARVALAGNPSDGYGGAVVAATIEDFCARVEARTDPAGRIRPESDLVRATVERFARTIDPAARHVAIRWRTSIPRSVGLGGSSAIVIATVQALCALHWTSLSAADLAAFALAVETEDLGIAAGLQDRVAQAYGGLTFMDFKGPGHYEQLDADLLPRLVVAWRADAHEHSGAVHASFDARARMLELDPRHVEMIETARACGAGANYAGSGGSIVCVCSDRTHQAELIDRLRALGAGATAPTVSTPGLAARS